ncbi:MAG TPA: MFS transporter [Croceibacterium sp.]|nr:MFS transporter [Croceibacterium sp.]
MATVAGAQRLVLSESRLVRLFSFFFLYFGQGLPLGMTVIALPAWLAANGAPDADVGLIAATAYLPWSFKFIPAFVMDRYAYLPMGRRRLWLILAQGLMMVAFAIAAVAAPGVDDIQLLVTISFLIGAGSAIQDVAVDGLAVDILPDREQGTASSFMFGGQTVGRSAAAAASGTLLFLFGSQIAFLCFIPAIAIVTVYVILLRERPGEKRFPWSPGAAAPENLERHVGDWLKIFAVAIKSLFRRDSFVLVASAVAQRTGEGILLPLFPILATSFLAYNEATYSQSIATIDFVMALTAIAVGSFLTLRWGPKRAAMLVFMVEAAFCAFILLGRDYWTIGAVFVGLLALQSICSTLSSITTNPLRMQLSDPRVAAAQFTIYNSIGNLPVSFGSATVFVWLGGSDDLTTTMAGAVALFALGTVILAFIRIGGKHVEAQPVPPID